MKKRALERKPKKTKVWIRKKLKLVVRKDSDKESDSEFRWSDVEEPEGYRSEEY